jgi:hypothetical protein
MSNYNRYRRLHLLQKNLHNITDENKRPARLPLILYRKSQKIVKKVEKKKPQGKKKLLVITYQFVGKMTKEESRKSLTKKKRAIIERLIRESPKYKKLRDKRKADKIKKDLM